MKDTCIPTCEKSFLLKAINENLRLDERQFDEYRKEIIHFGIEWGNCLVTLGETRVLAQVSCDIQPPKASKPNEGLLYVHVEMSPMAGLYFDANKQSDISTQVNRLLEKCLKESKCVDLEALCIVADEKVWNIRIDLNVMNYEGNLAGCCSIAALAALAHFKHPDVTSTGEKVIIHSSAEKDPIPINLHHYPVIISYALFNNGKHILSDPTALEENVADSLLLLSVNSYREICGMHLEGLPLPSTDVVIKCSRNAMNVAAHLVKQIKRALATDLQKRSEVSFGGLSESLDLNHIYTRIQEIVKIDIRRENRWRDMSVQSATNLKETDEVEDSDEVICDESTVKAEPDSGNEESGSKKYSIKKYDRRTAELTSKYEFPNDSDSSLGFSSDTDDVEMVSPDESKDIEEIQLSENSEEDAS